MPDYITAGSFSRSSTPINIVRPKVKKYTLTDLRKDPEFNEITERFLSSIGQGDSVGDLFGYFRGADYNLADGIAAYSESKNFTSEQKQDYQYLRNKFDNSSLGGIGEWVKAGANVTKEMFTDPTMMASILFVPWTGGASAAARIAASKAVQTGLKALTSKELAKGVAKGVAKIPGQKIKEPLSKNAITAITSAEGMLYGSSNDFVRQNIDINTDRRDNINLARTATIGAIGATIPVGIRGLGAGISKFQNSVADRRLARIDGSEDYKAGVLDKGLAKTDEIIDQLTPNLLKLTRFVQKPTSHFVAQMKESQTLDKLIKIFRHDTAKRILDDPSKIVEKTGWSFYENVWYRLGPKREKVKEILDTLKEKGKVTKPKIGSKDAFFKVPSRIYDAPEATKQSYWKWQRISDPVNDALAYYLRTGRKTVTIDGKRLSFEKAFKMTEKTTDDVLKAGNEIKLVLREIRNDAKAAGLEVGRIVNYLPRGFNFRAVQKELENLKEGIEGSLVKEIRRAEGVTERGEMIDVLESILNPTTPTGKSYSLLMKEGSGGLKGTRGVSAFGIGSKKIPSFTKKRQLRNIDETRIDDYLDNNVENLLYDYTYSSSSFIQRKIDLGEDAVEFAQRFLKPIQKELKEKGKPLSTKDYEKLVDVYLVTTGQVRQLDTGFRQALADIAIVGNQLALLPLATITSLSEIAVPLVRGAGKKLVQKGRAGTEKEIGEGGIRTIWKTAGDYRKMWWNDVVKKDLADARPQTLKELNRFGRAWDRASEDRSLAMFGQGYGRRGTMAQNKFFKINLLHDWTRFVQLTSFNVGKSKIYENLYELATVKNIKKSRRIRLENQLRELNVDIGAGKRWVNNGGKPNGKFYNENFLPSAARYVDEVIMNPTAAANQKPLWHSMPSTRWAFGLMGFPTAFSNTVLKNAIREINFDVRTLSPQATPEIAAGATAMISIGMFGNTIRTGGRNLEEIEKGEETIGGEIFDAAIRTGLLGPTEQLYRTQRGTEYDNFARSIVQRFTGPAVDDIFRFFEDWNGPLSFAVDELPGITLLRTANPDLYKAVVKGAREYDKAMGLTAKGPSKKKTKIKDRPLFSKGGRVKLVNPRYKNFDGGEIDTKQNPVPNVVPEPSERINPYTGEPYEAEMERLGFKDGLLVSIGVAPVSDKEINKLKKSLKKRQAKVNGGDITELSDDQKQYIAFYNMAVEAGNAFPEIVAAQASLESSHGTSVLTTDSNNPLGIKVLRKAEVDAGQKSILMNTKEFKDGKEITSKEPFRVYDSMEESFVGYKEKVAHPRYDSIREATNKEEYAKALQESGYASDPEYADKIVGIADRYESLVKKRQAKQNGGEIRQRYAFGDRIKKALQRRGEGEIMRAELMPKAPETLYMKTLQGVADAANIDYEEMQNRANKESLRQNIPDKYREGFANALQHLDVTSKAVMDNPERHKKAIDLNRFLLQGKEIIQHVTEGREPSRIDMFNNRTGLNLGKKYIGGSYEDLRKEQIDIVLRSIQKLENNEELIPGKDVVF